ncbi:MAG TPA: ribonuclease HI family protein [Caldilineaceae bacterium]|nr:ribonuclease HI family protein [Caldilineaceae bacterium]
MWNRNRSPSRLWLFCDGSTGLADYYGQSRTDPVLAQATCAAAAVARSNEGDLLDWAWQPLPSMTNNEAEYAGLILGLHLARKLRAKEVVCALDSDVVVGQMEGRYAVHSPALRPWHWRACEAARGIQQVRYCHIPREWNRLADGMATQAGIPWAVLRGVVDDRVTG